MIEALTQVKVKPRLAFVGTGWIGLNLMNSLIEQKICEPVAIFDTSELNANKANSLAPQARICKTFNEVIESKPEGIVIATPNAFHKEQCIAALENGIPVFCQKPLALNVEDTKAIIDAARKADKLLAVDMSYRFTEGMQKIKEVVRRNELGKIFAADLVFYNVYGPDKQWFYNPALSGGGCLIDLGVHLIDLALWILDFPELEKIDSTLISNGAIINKPVFNALDDFVSGQLETKTGVLIRMACSWNLPAGIDAEIRVSFYGSKASACFQNVDGSFYDFKSTLSKKSYSATLSYPPEKWGGNAISEWVKTLQKNNSFDEEITNYIKVAEVLDRIYGRI